MMVEGYPPDEFLRWDETTHIISRDRAWRTASILGWGAPDSLYTHKLSVHWQTNSISI